MTYREKLKMEHPEKVDKKFIGGCNGCPSGVGYGPESVKNGCVPNEAKCTACWNKVIPGTEEREYENLSRDELIALVKLLDGRIDTKNELIARYTAACTDKNKEIENLKEQIAKLEHKNETYSNVCAIYKSKDAIIEKQEKEIERRGKLLDERDNEIQELKRRNENQAEYIRRAKVTFVERDKEIAKLNDKIEGLNTGREQLIGGLQEARKQIDELQQKLKHSEANVAAYQLMAHSTFGSLRPCNCSGCDEKDKEIERLKKDLKVRRFNEDFWYDEYLRLSKKVGELVNSNQELKDALAKEKSEHAKHHGINSLFCIID